MAYSSVNFALFVCCLFCVILGGVLANTCNFNVRLTQALLNDGFHRNITYGIVFNADDERARWMYQGCILGLEQTLPQGVFVNPDELGDLRRSDRLSAIPKRRVNVEVPAEESEPMGVYIIGKVTSSMVYLWLPVHARYHHAVAGGGTARNTISAPHKMYLRCPDQRLKTCDRNVIPAVTFFCNGSSKEKCSWMEIPFTVMSEKLTWDVPVGNTEHYHIVAGGTLGVIIVGSIYLIKTIHEYKVNQKKKKQ